MIFKRTLVLLSLASLLLMMGGSFLGSSHALARVDYSNGPGTLTGEGDPGDGSDSLASGGGGTDANYSVDAEAEYHDGFRFICILPYPYIGLIGEFSFGSMSADGVYIGFSELGVWGK